MADGSADVLNDVAVENFDTRVNDVFESEGNMLMKMFKNIRDDKGDSVRFPLLHGITAQPRVAAGSSIQPQSIMSSTVLVSATTWRTLEYIDRTEMTRINYDDRGLRAEKHGRAGGRRRDQIFIDALTNNHSWQIPKDFSASKFSTLTNPATGVKITALGTIKLSIAVACLQSASVPSDNRILLMDPFSMADLVQGDDAKTIDSNMTKTLVAGEMKRWYGFDLITIDDRPEEGGLPFNTAGDARLVYAFNPSQMGIHYRERMEGRMDVRREEWGYFIATNFTLGATVIQPKAVVQIEAAASLGKPSLYEFTV